MDSPPKTSVNCCNLCPNLPLTTFITLSPFSTMFAIAASIAEVPDPVNKYDLLSV